MILLEWLKIVVVFLVMISILVAAHEYGHYLFARIFRMGVEEFAVGFGKKPLWVWLRKKHRIPLSEAEGRALQVSQEAEGADGQPIPTSIEEETLYTFRPWPAGGFVRIKGMVPEEDGSEVRIPGGFYSKAPWKRFLVLLAGPLFSVLAGVVLLFGLFSVFGMDVQTSTVIHSLSKTGAAYKGGLRPGDKVLAADGQPVHTAFDLVRNVRGSAGKAVLIQFERNHLILETTIRPEMEKEPSPVLGENMMPTGELKLQAKVGVTFDPELVRLGPGAAAAEALNAPVSVIQGLEDLVSKKVPVEDSVGGPVAILGATKQASDAGFRPVIYLAAMLSISVGIFNLIPIYPLDGCQMLVAVAEMLRGGKRLSMRVQGAVAGLGFAVLLLMVVSVFFVDINRAVKSSKAPAADSTLITK